MYYLVIVTKCNQFQKRSLGAAFLRSYPCQSLYIIY